MRKPVPTIFHTAALVALGACALAASTHLLAQTTSLRPPATMGSGATESNRTQLGGRPQITATPGMMQNNALATPVAVPTTPGVVAAKRLTIQSAHVSNGASLSAQQKMAAAAALLAAEAKQAQEEQDKQALAAITALQQHLTVATGATLSLASASAPWGNASLSMREVYIVDFANGLAQFHPKILKTGNGSMSHPSASCSFKPPEPGFYLVDFLVAAVDQSVSVTATLTNVVYGQTTPNTANASLVKGDNHVLVSRKFAANELAFATVTSDNYFAFKSCEISRLK